MRALTVVITALTGTGVAWMALSAPAQSLGLL